ncbi:MAG: PAS domain S-box protein [Deltaproteobacteria bacterium]|nr:PAS domain S-box protein [Deltaproteobacteria bacterium]
MEFPNPITKNRRRERERYWIILSILLLALLSGFLEGRFLELRSDLPFIGNILLFGLINLNVILLLLLTFLVLRNIAKLIFERKKDLLGSRLKTKLVVAFVGLTFIPTLPLFWLATHLLFSSLDSWFSHQVEQSLEQSVALGKDYLEQEGRNLLQDAASVGEELADLAEKGYSVGELPGGDEEDGFPSTLGATPPEPVGQKLRSILSQYQLDAMLFCDRRDSPVWQVVSGQLAEGDMSAIAAAVSQKGEIQPKAYRLKFSGEKEGLGATFALPPGDRPLPELEGRLVVIRLLPSPIKEKLASITSGYDDYLQLKLMNRPIRISHIVTFSIVMLLAIFAGVWFGFFLAKSITGPLQALLDATQMVAGGRLDVHLDSERRDEMGQLMASFNKMVRDLREGREKLGQAYGALQESNAELEEQRLYMEIVLGNIAAGVVSADAEGRIVTVNKSAEKTLGLNAAEAVGKPYWELITPDQVDIVKEFVQFYRINRQPRLERQVQVMIGGRLMVLLVKASVLLDDEGDCIGVVLVFDDLTELEKAQRMAAWREVARRIAHEIKNPITPIQLCAQRLRRQYLDRLGAEGGILDECTRTIVQQVDQMKHLVNEFSRFARLPSAQLASKDLGTIVDDAMSLYRHTYPHISFCVEKCPEMPLLRLDEGQMKQVIINLLENSIQALDGEEGTISIRLFHDAVLRIARLECADTGHGLSPEDKLRMFEPYYSTRERGTGLGLAIVASIVADHNGFVRVRDNVPRGTVIVIELPA